MSRRAVAAAEALVAAAIVIAHNFSAIYLLMIWSFAAFGEEFACRGYLLRRTIAALGGSTRRSVAAGLLCGALFGVGHFYQGLVGMIDSTVSGLVFGTLYVRSGGNLCPSTLAHGLTDTLALALDCERRVRDLGAFAFDTISRQAPI